MRSANVARQFVACSTQKIRGSKWMRIVAVVFSVTVAHALNAEEFEAFTEPYKRVAVPSPEMGVIETILVKEGDEVKKGQVLAKLDDSILHASLDVAEAAKDAKGAKQSAEAEVSMREKQLESFRELRDRGNATQRELERAEHALQQAQSKSQSVREDLGVRGLEYARVQTQLNHRKIESPINGFVVAIDKEAGEFVAPTDAVIMHVVHLDALRAVFSIPYELTDDLRRGQSVSITIGLEKQASEGSIDFVSPIADAESGTVQIKVKIPNPNRSLRSGVTCRWDASSSEPSNRLTARDSKQQSR